MIFMGCRCNNKGKNLIVECLKYLIMFSNQKKYGADLNNDDVKFSAPMSCGSLIDKMVATDETLCYSQGRLYGTTPK